MLKLTQLFEKYSIELTKEQINLFQKFLEIFFETNSQINLSAIRDEDGIIEKHFIDSIMLTKFSSIEGKILDLGTGGGFPGIPLNMVDKNNSEFILVDSIGKKVRVVNEFIQKLKLKNIKAICGRAEELGQNIEYRGKFNMVVSRATAYLPTLVEYAIPFLKVGGIFVCYKLDNDEEISDSKKALDLLNAEIIEIKKYEINGQKRIFIFIQKIAETHKKYPRIIGEALKNPLK
ncbi:MAG: 16S rRNA (guanine(527)-N(7))-methyltransferase RsmG [Candidatus Gracilibacteria bacterium]|nr:16S rRNA (guanine(527)-N(7))-methyltransferase RsmG [Candidatus Gracilibacteria bacterium]